MQTNAKSIHCSPKHTKKNWLKIGSVDQKLFKFQLTRVWELLKLPGTERDIAFSQLAVKGLNSVKQVDNMSIMKTESLLRWWFPSCPCRQRSCCCCCGRALRQVSVSAVDCQGSPPHCPHLPPSPRRRGPRYQTQTGAACRVAWRMGRCRRQWREVGVKGCCPNLPPAGNHAVAESHLRQDPFSKEPKQRAKYLMKFADI
jgi:hypothetical protein